MAGIQVFYCLNPLPRLQSRLQTGAENRRESLARGIKNG